MYAISGYEDTPPNYYLNIYESDKNYEEIGFMDSIKLDYIPYQLTNTTHGDDESCFMLTGSDNKCHVYLYDRDNHCFGEANEDYVNDIFPELNDAQLDSKLYYQVEYHFQTFPLFGFFIHYTVLNIT